MGGAGRSMVRARGLGLRYGSLAVLEAFEVDVGEGEFFAMVGPSGCGKTTLLDLVMGLQTPSAGTLDVRARRPAMVFQRPQLLPWRTVLDNATYGLECLGRDPSAARDPATQLLTQMRLEPHLHDHPHQLSEGMKQRVNLARALLVEPDLLLMDEPFAALDPLTRRRLQDDLLALWQERKFTVVFVSHSLEEVAYLADRIAVASDKPCRIRESVDVALPRPRATDPAATLTLLELADGLRRRFFADADILAPA